MANERRENDRQVEELRGEADELERLVSVFFYRLPSNCEVG